MDDVIYPDCPTGLDGEPTHPHQRDRARSGCCPYCGVRLAKMGHKEECPIGKALESSGQNEESEELEDQRFTTEHPCQDAAPETDRDAETETKKNICASVSETDAFRSPHNIGKEISSISGSEAVPSAPYYSPRKRNWHKRDIPSWSHDDKAVYEAICVHLKIGKGELHGKKAERAASLYRAILARWRSVYKEGDLLVSGLTDENVKKMLQRLKRKRESLVKWLNDPSTAEDIADAMELHFLYPDRVRLFEDGSYAFVDKDGELSGDRSVIYEPIEDDNDADDERIMNILKDKGILPPKDYSDVVGMMAYMESFRLQKQAERDQWEQEHREDIEHMKSVLGEAIEAGRLKLEESLTKASALPPPDLNAIFGVNPSNISRQPSPRKDDPSTK